MTATRTGQTAIAGIGQTEFSKESGRSELQLACEAVKAAIDDAGLDAGRRRRPGHLHDGLQTTRSRSRATSASGDLTFFVACTTAAARRRAR